MPISQQQHVSAQSANRPVYRGSFVRHSHDILAMGYVRLQPSDYRCCEEEDITGELVRSMQEALQSRTAPRWAKNFWACEETPVHDPTRRGKKRRRIDIEVIKAQSGVRPRFRFEAKRLHDVSSRGTYLGREGLGRFLKKRYARDDEVAGMLGYVQAGTVNSHAQALEEKLSAEPDKYAILTDGRWTPCVIAKSLTSFQTVHGRATLPAITMLHTLLPFC